LRKYSIEPHDVIICLSVEEILSRTSCDLSTSSTEINYHMRFYWVLPQLRDKLSHHEVLLGTSSTERQIITWGSTSQLRKCSIEPHDVIICLSVEEVLNRTSCDNLSQLRKYSIEPHVIIFLSVEEVLNRTSCNWETNYHMRFYWVLPQLRDKLSHEVLLSTSSTERKIITWGSIEYFNFQTNLLNRTSCDNFSLSWGSTQ
jgi:hypothetical protein